jgi:hypothetical protein
MHAEAYEAVGDMVKDSGIDFREAVYMVDDDGNDYADAWRGLDIGGRDVNGTARAWFPHTLWQGLDIRPGPGVDIVADATVWGADVAAWDFVLSTECLEHVEHWRGVVRAAASALDPEGPMLAFFTAASTGRGAHGASGEHTPPPGEWYGNVAPNDLSDELGKWFEFVAVRYNPNPGDVYAWARGVKR